MNEKKQELRSYFDHMSLFLVGLFFLSLPLVFLPITTESFFLPKQIFLSIIIGLFFILFGLKTISEGKLTFRTSPFGGIVALFILIIFLSALFSLNRYDALISFVPLLFTAFLYFGIVNTVKTNKQIFFLIACLVLGAAIASLITLFSYFNIYLFPLTYTQFQGFSTFGSLLDQAIYLIIVLPIIGTFIYSKLTKRTTKKNLISFDNVSSVKKQSAGIMLFFIVSFIIIFLGTSISIYELTTTTKPNILPFEIGLQTGFAAISQDNGNIFKSFFLGSGVGTFLTDFTRFKAASYNNYQNLWSLTFLRSSTWVLELLATTGILGIVTFLLLIIKIIKEKALFLSLFLTIIAAFVLPFSFTTITLFFILLAIFAVNRMNAHPDKYAELEFYFVALKRKHHAEGESNNQRQYGRFLAFVVCLLLLLIIGTPLYYIGRFLISDILFRNSLVAASQNQGYQTYNLQIAAIKMFPYRDSYYRSYSQTNLALANSILSQIDQKKDVPENTQKNIVTLIQQGINAGRTATAVAPLTSFNWNNLSSIYRGLIGFGQNADKFAILTSQQAVNLDPTNPQQYVELGGIYYQLGSYNEAIRQFEFAINLKKNYPNAYYNLGHALEEKGDLQSALNAYSVVQKLVENDPENTKKITEEIAALQKKIANGQEAKKQSTTDDVNKANTQLKVNKPKTVLPERDPKVKIPAPTVTPVAKKTKTSVTITPSLSK